MSIIRVSFPEGVQVAAQIGDFEVLTDQPIADGGANTAPSPYDFFLASIATCAGFYALRFCQQRQLTTDNLGLSLDIERHPETRRLEKIQLVLQLPQAFPEKYQRAIVRSVSQCSVKKALTDPPEINLTIAKPDQTKTDSSDLVQ